jgi:hypothetical protein
VNVLVYVPGLPSGGVHAVGMAEPVRARRLSDDEGRRLQQIVRRGTGSPIRLRRAMVIMASASGNTVPAIARLVQGDEDAVREVIHLRWRNANARHPDVLAAQRRERARIRSERQRRWGHTARTAA